MKNFYILISFLVHTTHMHSQIRYEDLDKISKNISEIQLRSKITAWELSTTSFAEENFKVFFYSKQASYVYFVKDELDEEIIEFNDKIDFSKAIGISYPLPVEMAHYIDVIFPAKTIRTTSIKNGKVIRQSLGDVIRFFHYYYSEEDRARLFYNLSELILLLKVYKGIMTEDKAYSMLKSWKYTVLENTIKGYNTFLKKYPQGIFSETAKDRAKKNLKGDEYYYEIKNIFDTVDNRQTDSWTGSFFVSLYGKCGFMDTQSGQLTVPLKYDEIGWPSEGLVKVRIDNKWGFINKEGKEVIPLQYNSVLSFSNDKARVSIDGENYFYIDKTGKMVE